MWTVDLTVEVKLRFQISKAQCGRRLSVSSLPVVATQKFLEKPIPLFEPALFSRAVSLFRVTCQVVSSRNVGKLLYHGNC